MSEDNVTPRPKTLANTATKCGSCIYFRMIHPKTKGICTDVWKVKHKSTACIDYEHHIDPDTYRSDSRVQVYNNMPCCNTDDVHTWQDEVRSLSGNVFQRSVIRDGTNTRIAPIRAVLRRDTDTSILIPFFEEVQRYRDRVTEIFSMVLARQGQVDLAIQTAEGHISTIFPELRQIKPEAIRQSVMRSIIQELYAVKSVLDTVHVQCENAIRNITAEHHALVEIQVSARSPVNIPKSVIEEKESGKYIPRKKNGRR